MNVYDHVAPGLITGDVKAPASAVTWWFTVSRFDQVTVSPTATVTEAA